MSKLLLQEIIIILFPQDFSVADVERVMELDCLQMNAKSFLIDCHSFGYFLFTVCEGRALNLLFTVSVPIN